MTTLLRIDTSSRIIQSHSRQLADYAEAQWRKRYPEGRVIYRDLVKTQIPHIHNDTIAGFYTPEEAMTRTLKQATALSDELIAELQSCDALLISSPLYNLSVPSNLKAWIDQVVRVGQTFAVNEDGSYRGLLNSKKAYLALVKGGIYKGTPMEAHDYQTPYLKAILHHMGIETEATFSLEGSSNPEYLKKYLPEMLQEIKRSFNN